MVVKAYHTDPGAGLSWPDDFQAMTTAQIAVHGHPARRRGHGRAVLVDAHDRRTTECLLMIASSSGDPSNVDAFAAGESIPEWRLVPHDNNIGQRNIHPVPAAGGAVGIMAVLDGRAFTVHNPFDHRARIVLDVRVAAGADREGLVGRGLQQGRERVQPPPPELPGR